MSELADPTIIKIVLFMGGIMLLISLLYPGANAAWSNLQTTIQTGPNFPTFQQPNTRITNYTLDWGAPGSAAPDSTTDCSSTNWNECLKTGELVGNVTFHQTISVVIAPLQITNGFIPYMVIKTECRNLDGHYTGLTFNLTRADGTLLASLSKTPICYPFPYVVPFEFTWAGVNVSTESLNNALLNIDTWGMVGQNHDSTELAFVKMQVFVQGGNPTCSFLDVGCALTGAVNTILQPFIWLYNAVVYVIQMIWAIISFIGSIIIGVLVGLFTSLLYLFNLPGAPLIVQGAVDVIAIAMVIIVVLYMLDRALAAFGGAVNKT